MRWLWVIALAACGRDPQAPPPTPKPPATKPVPSDASVALVEIPLASPRPTDWFIEAVTTDNKHALLIQNDEAHELHYRVVALPGGALETDIDLPALSKLPRETMNDDASVRQVKLDLAAPAIADELRRIGPVLAPFPLGAGDRIAAAPDGKHVAFNAGDWIYTAVDGAIVTRVASEASYHPWFTPDGKTLLFQRMTGTIDGIEGKYEVFATSVDGKQPPKRLAGTAAIGGELALTDAGTLRAVTSYEPNIPTCVIEIGLAAPFRVGKLGCLPDHEHLMECMLSPKGAWVACHTDKDLPELDPNSTMTLADGGVVHTHKTQFRSRAMEVATGKVTVDRIGPGSVSAIGDDGRFLLDAGPNTLLVFDARGSSHAIDVGDVITAYGKLIDPTHLVVAGQDKLWLVDVR